MQPPSSLLRPSGYFSTASSSAFASHRSLAFTSTQHKQRSRRVERGAVPLAQARSCARSGNGGGQGDLPHSPHSRLTPSPAAARPSMLTPARERPARRRRSFPLRTTDSAAPRRPTRRLATPPPASPAAGAVAPPAGRAAPPRALPGAALTFRSMLGKRR